MADTQSAGLVWGARLVASGVLVAVAVLATWWVAYPQRVVLWALLLIALVLLWLTPRVRSRGRARAVPAPPEPDPVDVAMRTRLTSAQAELASLRGVQRELLAAKQAAEAAMLAKSEFLASMSHEIRTPLNGILPLLDIVLGTDLSPSQREYLATANASAQELLRIVDDILDYSKVEAGKLHLESVRLNIRDVVDGVRRLLEKPAEAKGLAMRSTVDDDVRPVVRGDPIRMRQILTNLVGNAVKFTQRGSVSVRVSRRRDTDTQHELLFAVRDTGVGLAPEAAARLFQPFSQADATVTRRYGGTGLGLAICKKLVDLMGGRIGVRSEPGRGSEFWFTIPFEKAPGDIIGARPRQLAGTRTLLVAGPQRAQVILPVLATLALETSQVTDTAAALPRLRAVAPHGRSFRFDLLVVDADSASGDVAGMLRAVLRDRQLDSLHLLAVGLPSAPDPRVVLVPAHPDDAELRRGVHSALGLSLEVRPQPVLSAPHLPATVDNEPRLSGRVLLVEDHPVNQKVAKKLLERLGLTVELAVNGEIALERLRRQDYSMVLMDCQMPVLDGYSATRRLRETENANGKPRTPVVAMTAHVMAGDRERCRQAGMDDYLAKPIDRRRLAHTLAHWLPSIPEPVADAESAGASKLVPNPCQLGASHPADPVSATAPEEAELGRPDAARCGERPGNARPMPAQAASDVPSSRPDTARCGEIPGNAQPTSAPALSEMNTPPHEPLDNTTLVDLESIMGDELVTLVDAYLRDGSARMQNLHAAAERGDGAEVGKLAHSLKSSSANLGAMALATRAREVEEAARSGTLYAPADSAAALERLYADAASALRQRYKRS